MFQLFSAPMGAEVCPVRVTDHILASESLVPEKSEFNEDQAACGKLCIRRCVSLGLKRTRNG